MAFKDKNEFEIGDPGDEFPTKPFSPESDMEPPDEESPDDEFAELSEEEMKPFTLSEWQQVLPGYTAQEFEEKIIKRTRSIWMAPVASCLFGIFLGAAIAGVLVDNQPKLHQVRTFFIFFVVLAPLFSGVWYWFFTLRPESLARKMKDEQENSLSSEPIHPK
ncbi:MAG TPA: hypothetical protein VFR24_16100 [Candidatus Angelobacter sp.]|nr:hypothetical protein [Candidatus Angelobacter sp.]